MYIIKENSPLYHDLKFTLKYVDDSRDPKLFEKYELQFSCKIDFVASIGPTHVRPRILNGWKHFIIDNQLKFNDTCHFELIEKIKYVFKFRISRA